MATTPNAGIVYPVVGNILTPLATHFANLANSVDTMYVGLRDGAIGGIGTDAQRVALTGAFKREGYQWYSTDTDYEWFWTGTAWLMKPGQLLATHYSTPANVTTTGTVLGAIITTPTLPTGQKFVIQSDRIGLFSNATGPIAATMRWTQNGTTVTNASPFVRFSRSYSSTASSVVSASPLLARDTMTTTNTVSAALFLDSGVGTVSAYGADGFFIHVVTG